jgi:uncharacterized protein YfaS (alpha-2-macroglobulin family)
MATLQQVVQLVFEGVDNASSAAKNVGSALNELDGKVSALAAPFGDLADKILKLDLILVGAAATIGVLSVREAAKFETSLVDLNKVLGEGEGQASDYAGTLKELALTYGVNANELVLSAADFRRSGKLKLAAKPPILPIQPVSTNGMAIDRSYEKVLPDGTFEPLDQPSAGDLIRVSLRITLPNNNSRYLVIDDPLPAIFEAVNSDFDSQRSARGIRTSEKDWQISHSELRDDRAVFFFNRFYNRGTYTVTYLARCTLRGEAIAPPAKIEEMYNP